MTSEQRRRAVDGRPLLYARLLGTAALVVTADQFTKQLALEHLPGSPVVLIPGVLGLRLTYNSGGAFGLMQGMPWLFLAAGVAIVGLILVWAGREGPQLITPFGLVLGGGLGNMADRIFRGLGGRVVDFIDLTFWPTFNVADMAIVVGVALLAISSFRGQPARAGT